MKKEKLLVDVRQIMMEENYDADSINDALRIVTFALKNYSVEELTTEIVPYNNQSEQFLKLYIGTLLTEGKSKTTIAGYERLIRKFFQDSNYKPLNDITVYDLRLWLGMEQQRVSPVTAENYRTYLVTFFRWLASEEFIDKDPSLKIKPIKFNKQIKKSFTNVEIDKLRSACTSLRDRAMVEFLLSSGARVAEVSDMNISDIDFNSMEVHIRHGKGDKPRITYINEVCCEHLKNYIESRTDDDDCLFYSRLKKRCSKDSIENDLKRIGKLAGVVNVHPHRFRRTFATNLNRKGMDVSIIQKLLGHTNLNTTMTYIAVTEDQMNNEYRRYS